MRTVASISCTRRSGLTNLVYLYSLVVGLAVSCFLVALPLFSTPVTKEVRRSPPLLSLSAIFFVIVCAKCFALVSCFALHKKTCAPFSVTVEFFCKKQLKVQTYKMFNGSISEQTVPEVSQLQVRQSLWQQILPLLEPVEIDEIQDAIGHEMIEDNEVCSREFLLTYHLHKLLQVIILERDSLLEILQQYRQDRISKCEKSIEFTKRSLNSNSSTVSLLKNNINTLLNSLHNRAKTIGKQSAEDILVQTPREKQICT